MSTYNNDLTALLSCIADQFGKETGKAIKAQVAEALGVEAIDVGKLKDQIAQINAALTPNGQGQADAAAALTAALAAIANRVSTLENSTAVSELTAIVATLGASVEAEAARAQAAEAALDAKLATINITLTEVNQALEAVKAGETSTCDCPAINAALAQAATDLSNLKASDAGQEQRISDLQTLVVTLQQVLSTVNAAIEQAGKDAADAKDAANKADAKAQAAIDSHTSFVREHAEVHAGLRNDVDRKVDKDEIQGINCESLAGAFRDGIAAGIRG